MAIVENSVNASSKSKAYISVLIPAFNEEKSIEETIVKTLKALEAIHRPYEIIVVDDGSGDKTKEVANRYPVVVLTSKKNGGKGHALRRGIQYASGEIIVTLDADGSHAPEEISKLVHCIIEGADIVTGSRFCQNIRSNSTRKLNMFGNSMINLLVRIATGRSVSDSQSGFRAFRRKILEEINIVSTGYEVETELIIKTLRNGNVSKEVPITFSKRQNGHSHLNPLRDGFRIFKTIIRSSVVL